MKERRIKTKIQEMTLVDHLSELRRRIIVTISTVLVAFFVGFYFSPRIVNFFLNIPGELVYLYPGEAFFAHLKIAFVFSLILGFPIILYQVISFVLPGLNSKEKKVLTTGLPFAMLLFIVGITFGYTIILPIAYKFFMGFGTKNLQPLISIGNYISFVVGLIIPFGIVFQLPLIVLLLTNIGILKPAILVRYRKHTIFLVFILSAILTPPDVISQTLMAIPMLLLYEFSILLSRFVFRKKFADE